MLLTKSFYNRALLRSDLRRIWPLLGGYTLLWLLILPMHLLRELGEVAPEFAASSNQYVLEDALYATNWIGLLAGLLLAASLFSYLTSIRATYGLHSLPVSRGCQFRTHVLCGVGGVVCCNVLITVLTVLVQLGSGVPCGKTLSWLVCATVTFLLYFALGVLSCMLCGWMPAAVVAYGALNCIVLAAQVLVNMLCDIFYPSYNDSLFNIASDSLVCWFTPALRLHASLNTVALYARDAENAGLSAMWQSLLVYGIAAVVLLVAGALLYTIRRSECSGNTVAFKPLRPVVRWLVGLLGGLGLGVVFAALIGNTQDFALLLICSVILGLACMTGAQMLIAKTPRVFKKLWPELIALWLVIAALCTCMEKDVFGYENRIPRPEQVESVVVTGMWRGSCVVTEPDEIALVRQAHAYLQEHSDDVYNTGTGGTFTLTYALKDGSTLSRRYFIEDENRAGVLPMLEMDSFRRSVVMDRSGLIKPDGRPAIPSPQLKAEDLRIGYWDYNGQQQELTREQVQALYTAIVADAAAMDMSKVDLRGDDYCRMYIHLRNLDNDIYVDLYPNRQCTRTLQLLQDWGIIERPDDILTAETYTDEYNAALLN